MRAAVKIIGSFREIFEQHTSDGRRSVTKIIRGTTTTLKEEYRKQVRSNFKSRRLATTWQDKFFPARGESLGAAGLVFSRSPDIILAYSSSTIVVPRKGKYLVIPSAYNQGRPATRGGKRKPKVSTQEMQAATDAFILPTKNSNVKLWCLPIKVSSSTSAKGRTVRSIVTRSGGVAIAGGRGGQRLKRSDLKKRNFVPMFILVRQKSQAQRVNIQQPINRAEARIAAAIRDNWSWGSGTVKKPIR